MRCGDCRFWSERVAMSIGGGPVQALCLSQHAPYRGMYTTGVQGCEAGKPNTYGAIDSPGEEDQLADMYAAERDKPNG